MPYLDYIETRYHTVPVKRLSTPTHSMVLIYFYYFLLFLLILKTSKLWNNTWNHVVTKNRTIWPRRVIECCIRRPGLHNHTTSTQLRWFGMSWTAEWRKSRQQVLSICRNSFKTDRKAFLMKLVERMPRVYKAVIKAKGPYFVESQIKNIFCFV